MWVARQIMVVHRASAELPSVGAESTATMRSYDIQVSPTTRYANRSPDVAYFLLTVGWVAQAESLDFDVVNMSNLVVQAENAESDLGRRDALFRARRAFHVVDFDAVAQCQVSVVALV